MPQTLHGLFEAAARRYPDHVAVVYDDGDSVGRRTYQQVKRDVEEFKRDVQYLHMSGSVVGVCCSPNEFLPSLLIGILSVGAAFHPVDHQGGKYSLQGLTSLGVLYIITDVDRLLEVANFLQPEAAEITSCPFLVQHGFTLLKVNSDHRDDKGNSKPMSLSETGDEDKLIAYCITTSGTTGVPKVIRVPHRCIVPNIIHLSEIFDVSEDDLLFLASPLTFDPSIVEIFVTLTTGAAILIIPPVFKIVPRKFVTMVTVRHHVTVLQVTPTLIYNLTPERIRSSLLSDSTRLKSLVFGGEKCPSLSVLRRWRAPGNTTKLFNLYGTTEVSCWATCYRISEGDFRMSDSCDSVPLGAPLLDTELEVRDDNGSPLNEGEGELFIGGSSRISFIGEEKVIDGEGVLRPTGDRVRLTRGGTILYIGRTNEEIKRHGMRLNLLTLEEVVLQVDILTACAAVVDEGRLLLFITCNLGINSPDSRNEHDVIKSAQRHVEKSLPVQYHPDCVKLVPTLPFTKHGKVDKRELLRQARFRPLINHNTLRVDNVRNLLDLNWKDCLPGVVSSRTVDDSERFVEMGGDSFRAVRLVSAIENSVSRALPLLLDKILHHTFKTVCNYLCDSLSVTCNDNVLESGTSGKSQTENSTAEGVVSTKVPQFPETGQDLSEERPANRKRRAGEKGDNSSSSLKHFKFKSCSESPVIMSIGRGGRISGLKSAMADGCETGISSSSPINQELTENDRTGILTQDSAIYRILHLDNHCDNLTSFCDKCSVNGTVEEKASCMKLKEVWKYNTGKCVDASPLVVVLRDVSCGLVFIGSHSHTFSAVSLATGEELWERQLGDRVESSACLTACKQYVVVGSYDHCVYFLGLLNGETYFKYKTGGEVKSSPVADDQSSLIYVGSHDQHLYALSTEKQECVWRLHMGGGSVFSSPAVSYQPYQVIAASLTGSVLAVHPLSGTRLWQFRCDKPVFSSPVVGTEGICLGSVDGKVYFLSHQGEQLWTFLTGAPVFSSPSWSSKRSYPQGSAEEGEQLWTFLTGAPVFSSPSWSSKRSYPQGSAEDVAAVFIGSHDGCVYCISCKGELLWQHDMGAAVYATPFFINVQQEAWLILPDSSVHCYHGDGLVYATKNLSDSKQTCSSCGQRSSEVTDSTATGESLTTGLTSSQVENFSHGFTHPSKSDISSCSGQRLVKEAGQTLVNNSDHRLTTESGDKLTDAVCDNDSQYLREQWVTVCNTSGHLQLLDRSSGHCITDHRLPGQVFSSPVVVNNRILIGCRDNYLYCLQFHR